MYQKSIYHLQNTAKAREIANSIKRKCPFCEKITVKGNFKRHEEFCYLNPKNTKLCPVCNNPIKNYKTSLTCGYSCANKYTKTGPNNGMWKEETYRSTCFYYHKKKCVVCDECNIIEVHHLDENHENNSSDNLIPLCPTHHKYWHSRYRHLIEKQVLNYIENWSGMQGSNLRSSDPKSDGLSLS